MTNSSSLALTSRSRSRSLKPPLRCFFFSTHFDGKPYEDGFEFWAMWEQIKAMRFGYTKDLCDCP